MFSQLVKRIERKISIWQSRKSYIGSAAQTKFHNYIRDEAQLKKIKSTIDYQTINKNSKGRFMIREFLFQQKVPQNYIAPLDCYFLPVGKWTRQQFKDVNLETKTNTQMQNQTILADCEPIFSSVLKDYYSNIGKKGHKFIISQQISKISEMSQEEFNNFVSVFGQKYQDIIKDIKENEKA